MSDAGPSVTSATPPSVAHGTANQDLLVGGANLVSGATVNFSESGISVNSVTWNSAGQLTVNITVASNATTGAITITVVNPDQPDHLSTLGAQWQGDEHHPSQLQRDPRIQIRRAQNGWKDSLVFELTNGANAPQRTEVRDHLKGSVAALTCPNPRSLQSG